MSKIKKISITRIRKEDLPGVIYDLLDIVQKSDMDELGLNGVYNMLLELMPQLNIFAVKNDGNPLDKELKSERKLRKKLLSAILSQVRSIEKVDMSSHAEAVKNGIPLLKKFLIGATVKSNAGQTASATELLTELDANEEIKTTLSSFSVLTAFINELKACQHKINVAETLRRKAITTSMSKLLARKKINAAINDILRYIELVRIDHPDIDYSLLIKEVNVMLSAKQIVIDSRITRNINKMAMLENETTAAPSSITDATVASQS